MTTELRLSQIQSDRTPAVIGLTTLFLAILALSFAAIFIRLSERELGPVATIFNRFWVATLILGFGNVIKTLSERHSHDSSLQKQHYTVSDWLSSSQGDKFSKMKGLEAPWL